MSATLHATTKTTTASHHLKHRDIDQQDLHHEVTKPESFSRKSIASRHRQTFKHQISTTRDAHSTSRDVGTHVGEGEETE
ncbi:unnamed protein product [Ceratitis capitata]|uniref:(Mediterranean fruit fly) hypothetical protein n=1 Tax=Ceratitis capitata TaxID=7213 RepID=A0A811UJF1_CERCA|nr:unnamed protein product [Ceratitis capitata]